MVNHQPQKTRFAPTRLSRFVSDFKSHLRPPTHPSTTSESALGSAYNTDTYYQESVAGGNLPLDLLTPGSAQLGKYKKKASERFGARSRHRSSVANSTSRYGDDEDTDNQYEPVAHVVVDNDFEQIAPALAKSDGGSTTRSPAMGLPSTKGGLTSNRGEEDEEDEGNQHDEATSIRRGSEPWWEKTEAYEFIMIRIWPNIQHFFDSRFPEPQKERSYQKETWFMQKPTAMGGAAYLLIAWTLTVALQDKPLSAFAWYAYFGVGGFFTLPIPILVIYDVPRRQNWLWQPWLGGASWFLADILIIEMNLCGYFNYNNQCGGRSFLNLMGAAMSTPVLAILAMRQDRVWAMMGAVQWVVLVGSLIMTMDNYPALFYRNLVNFCLFYAFMITTSFLKERGHRQLFALRQQLKIQYRATQSAQVMERRAADSKKRFVSYIFHEVRVPLNTALLAVQNLEGEDVFKGLEEDQSEMVHGLMGSLTMMEKVLNDVLSFNRMESGKFEQARKPFEFHKSIQLVALSHRMQAQMAGIELIVELDRDIDKIGGMFVGDEMRLRQVTSNLVSNSIKFTDQGSVRIVTKLLYPRMEPTPGIEIDDPLRIAAINSGKLEEKASTPTEDGKLDEKTALPVLDAGNLAAADIEKGAVHLEDSRNSDSMAAQLEERRRNKAVVRVEIHDTGVGLKKQDIIDNRLFSPYVQTEIGRRQGGKGSGLGLALVRQIVKLSNGRLGVDSQYGKGSMFWFELPYSFPSQRKASTLDSPSSGTVTRFGTNLSVPPTPLVGAMDQAYRAIPPRIVEPKPVLTEPRPQPTTTDSEAPLLPRMHRRQSESKVRFGTLLTPVPPEEMIISTFTPVGGSAPTPPEGLGNDPFSQTSPEGGDDAQRRSSEWSETTKLDSQPGGSPPRDPQPPLPSPSLPLCTLVVDDDKLTRMLMSRMLTRLGHQVTTAENGKIALDMITASFEGAPNAPKYDIIFLDNQMPLMSGVEVAREVRIMGNPIYIVGCTGNALREDQDEYIRAGADGIIPKPIHQRLVLDMIKEARKRVAGETRPKDIEPDDNVAGGHHRI